MVKTTDYIDGFVYENNVLAYFGMSEGRVRNASGTLKLEYMIKDQQGNVRVSFEEQGGVAVVRQENSYYPFGLSMPGYTLPTAANKNLYNGGSEWQDDFADLPDLQQTFYRMYDAALGRFVAADPMAEASESMTSYQYALNNPIIFNDPLGDKAVTGQYAEFWNMILSSVSSNGSNWTWNARTDNFHIFNSDLDALRFESQNITDNGSWGKNGIADSYSTAADRFNKASHNGPNADPSEIFLAPVNFSEMRTNPNWLIERQKEAFGVENSRVTPWQVGWEWATGNGPRDRVFTNGDFFTETLRQHDHIKNTIVNIRSSILSGLRVDGKNPYKLGGVKGVGLYIKDYSTLATGGMTGNIAVTYLGSYNLTYHIMSIQGNIAVIQFNAFNQSTISSATHPPIIGYTPWWNNNVGTPLDKQFLSGPFSKTTQTFIWMETINLK